MQVQRTVTIIFNRECNSVKIILENPNYSEDSMTIKIISFPLCRLLSILINPPILLMNNILIDCYFYLFYINLEKQLAFQYGVN